MGFKDHFSEQAGKRRVWWPLYLHVARPGIDAG